MIRHCTARLPFGKWACGRGVKRQRFIMSDDTANDAHRSIGLTADVVFAYDAKFC